MKELRCRRENSIMDFVDIVANNSIMKNRNIASSVAMNCPLCKEEVYGTVCTSCGLVIDEKPIYYGPEYENNKEEKARSYIKWDTPDIGTLTTHSTYTKSHELKKAFKIEKEYLKPDKFGRNYIIACADIKRMCNSLRLLKIHYKKAVFILKALMRIEYIKKSRNKFATYAACIILATRLLRYPIDFGDVYKVSTEEPVKIKKAYTKIRNKLKYRITPFTLQEYLIYHTNKLGFDYKKSLKLLKFAKKITKTLNLDGKKMAGYSAAVIRMKTGMRRRDLSLRLGITEPTITSRMNELGRL